jgi:hypothetical protein
VPAFTKGKPVERGLMARKLKVYQTRLGFFDQAIAAPSMQAALPGARTATSSIRGARLSRSGHEGYLGPTGIRRIPRHHRRRIAAAEHIVNRKSGRFAPENSRTSTKPR